MVNIKVTHGACGIRYTDANGTQRFKTVTEADGYVECDNILADRFVRLGVAKYQETAEDVHPNTENAGTQREKSDQTVDHIDAAAMESMTMEQLRKLAGDFGADVSACKKKSDMIAAIEAVRTYVDDDDDLPDLDAVEPEQ